MDPAQLRAKSTEAGGQVAGIEEGRLWIEADAQDDARYLGGRNPDAAGRTRRILLAKAEAIANHERPDRYRW